MAFSCKNKNLFIIYEQITWQHYTIKTYLSSIMKNCANVLILTIWIRIQPRNLKTSLLLITIAYTTDAAPVRSATSTKPYPAVERWLKQNKKKTSSASLRKRVNIKGEMLPFYIAELQVLGRCLKLFVAPEAKSSESQIILSAVNLHCG